LAFELVDAAHRPHRLDDRRHLVSAMIQSDDPIDEMATVQAWSS
jgi:hypothetical protein